MIIIENLKFQYDQGEFSLNIPALSIDSGKCIALTGPSGSGKTTLLNIIAGIIQVNGGKISVAGMDISKISDTDKRTFRLNNIGMVFQSFALMPYLTITDNITLPIRLGGTNIDSQITNRCQQLLKDVDMSSYGNRYPDQLSQGQQQRVAICRALINEPKLVLADEPTGNLDHDCAQKSLELTIEQVRNSGATLIMSTHDRSLLNCFDDIIDINQIQQEVQLEK